MANKELVAGVQSSNQEIKNIISVIDEISKKTRVINDIVFQTKRISFNASVKAARAGKAVQLQKSPFHCSWQAITLFKN